MISRFILFLLCIPFLGFSQNKAPKTASEIHQAIKKLNVLGSVLYLAAHPDDENTRMISYLANHIQAETAYLSLTRGDGGQNLIGPEIRELLGVIRTQELLEARKIDGGQQFFSRANDFGFSKHPDETLKIWDKEKILADVVWIIRKFRPDVIINRWGHLSAGKTHGHHTASALLSVEAFDLAADPNAFPEQLKHVDVWQPTRLYYNVFLRNFEGNKSKLLPVDVGVYFPHKGKSNTEIAAESRSQHKCQGMGTAKTRGARNEYLEVIKGKEMQSKDDIFEGVNISWSRIKGSSGIAEMVENVERNFRHDDPSASVSDLLKIYNKINTLPKSHWQQIKLAETKNIIKACLGFYTEAIADDYWVTKGETIELAMEFVNRSPLKVQLEKITYLPIKTDSALSLVLPQNEPQKFYKKIKVPNNINRTNPYWLNEAATLGTYKVANQLLRGFPETVPIFKIKYNLKIENTLLEFSEDVVYKDTDPVKGDVIRRLEIIPPVFINNEEQVHIFPNDQNRVFNVILKSGKDNIKGKLSLKHPKYWRVEPAFFDFDLKIKGAEKQFSFTVFPPEKASEGTIIPIAEIAGKVHDKSLNLIDYDHIPTQTVLLPAVAKVVKLDIKKRGERVGYIMGAGDDIPTSLRQIDYQVDLLEDKDISKSNLHQYDAVILGIRAYNTKDKLKFQNKILLKYVQEGGTLIVQYNTGHHLVMPSAEIGPYPFQISRDRITVEEAEIRLLNPDHELLNSPNKITAKDFEGWVQERGLYFPNEWDEQYEALLSGNDPGEDAKNGGLLFTKYGKGHYIYTGYSWFRELPAGVPGAYRIFANLISVGK